MAHPKSVSRTADPVLIGSQREDALRLVTSIVGAESIVLRLLFVAVY